MKKLIVTASFTTAWLFVVATGFALSKMPVLTAIKKQGLYVEVDAATGFRQIYFRPFRSATSYQLTTTDSHKSDPKWGLKGVSFNFHDLGSDSVMTCDGDLFYYLEEADVDGSQVMMGCVEPLSSYSVVAEGYPLTGFSDEISDVSGYDVATGTDLEYDHDTGLHQAIPLVVYTDDERTILLHDNQEHAGETNYSDGLVAYYDDSGSGDLQTGLESGFDDDIGWNGVINCPRCRDWNCPTSEEDDEGNSNTNSNTNSSNQDTSVESSLDSESNQSTTQNTDSTNENQNQNTSSNDQTQSSQNANDVNVTVNVNVTDTNTATSESFSDYNGTVTSDSSSSETNDAEEASPTDSAAVSPSVSDDEDGAADPMLGEYHLQGGGACSLNASGMYPNAGKSVIITILCVLMGMYGLRSMTDARGT